MGPRREQDIFTATLELLVEQGYDRLAIEAVAARAEVNKTTIYRWWTSKDELLAAALVNSSVLEFPIPDTGSLRGDLLALASDIAQLLSAPPTAQIAAATLIATPDRPALAAVAAQFFIDRRAREQPVFERARARGELAAGTDQPMIMDMLAGTLWFRVLVQSQPAPGPYLATLVDSVLAGISRPGSRGPAAPSGHPSATGTG